MSKAKAVVWTCFIAFAAAILACGILRWPVAATSVRAGLNGYSATDPSAPRWAAIDKATFRVLPWPSLHFYNARLSEGDFSLLSAPEASVELSLGALLHGRFIPTRTIIKNPVITIDLNAPPFYASSWTDRIVNARSALAPLVDVSLVNGVVRIVDKPHNFDTVIEDVGGRIEGVAATDTLRVNLSAMWRETPLALTGSLAGSEPTAAEGDALVFGMKSPIADFAFSGSLLLRGPPVLNGDVAISVHSLSAMARLVGLLPPELLAADDVALSAKIKASGDVMIDDATITSAGQLLQGALQISSFRGRPVVSGTLDAAQLTVEPLLGSWPPLRNAGGEWSEHLFANSVPLDFDLDLRLSAASLDLYGRALTNAAGSVLLKGGEFTASLIEAGAYGGRLEGEARLSRSVEEVDLHARAKLSDADLGPVFSDLGVPFVTGRGTVELAVATEGRQPSAAVARLVGTASLEGHQGSIVGINLEEALRRSQRRPLDLWRDIRSGQTAFDRIALSALIAGGKAHIVSGGLFAHGLAANIGGFIDLSGQSLDLDLDALQTDASGEAPDGAARLTFGVTGPWSRPTAQARSTPAEKDRP